ncbi:hypothetical protein BDQ17DRAFT_1312173 [Cyathus striatus]|nr:hypothetical protein BDQ17DRAFT_1312173 [Cyathus striatus]
MVCRDAADQATEKASIPSEISFCATVFSKWAGTSKESRLLNLPSTVGFFLDPLLSIDVAMRLLSALLLLPLVLAQQTPLFSSDGEDAYQFKWPIRKVAVIGAGPGGLTAYRELTQLNFVVHLIERDTTPGGNWHYTDEVPLYTPIPNVDISVGDYEPSLPPHDVQMPYTEIYGDEVGERIRKGHRAPKPIWKGLTTNVPSPVQQIREFPWPKGTPWELSHQKVHRYLRAFASYRGINNNDDNPNVRYNTRVELAEEHYNDNGEREGWMLTLKTVTKKGSVTKATWTKEHYDAVLVATGRYNAPNVPQIPGLEAWAKAFPGKITHSREYRIPDSFEGKSVLIVGAATSGGDISREINPSAKIVYQSIRPDKATVPHLPLCIFLSRLPQNTTIVPEITRFLPLSGGGIDKEKVELDNGTILTGIDNILFGTGYRYTFPFLPQYTNSSLGVNDTFPGIQKQPIVTDGTHLRSLYLDMFYIDDPTLAFVNMNYGLQAFTYAEFGSLAIGKVWSRTAFLPSKPRLWASYNAVVEERQGYGKHFQFVGPEQGKARLRFLVAWLNDAAVKYGGRQIDDLPVELEEILNVWFAAMFLPKSVVNSDCRI